MQELHKIRAKLSRRWAKLTDEEITADIHRNAQEFLSQHPSKHHVVKKDSS